MKLALALLSIAVLDGCTAAPSSVDPRQTPTRYTVTTAIDGGNAIILSKDKMSAIVGAVGPRVGDPAFNDHRMDLLLVNGQITAGAEFMAPTGHAASLGGAPYWRLEGYDVRLCPDGQCPSAGELQPVNLSEPQNSCDGTHGDSLGLVPNLMALHSNSKLKPDWKTRLESRLHIERGTLRAGKVLDCFSFRRVNGQIATRRPMADGHQGVVNSFETSARFIDVLLSKNESEQRIRLTPSPGGISFRLVATEHPPESLMIANDIVTRFLPYYDLVVLDAGDHPLSIYYTPNTELLRVNPGGECPLGLLLE